MKHTQIKKASQLSTDSQSRLMAYTTAAGLGAFFAGQSVEAQVTLSPAFAPYPHTIIPGVAGGGAGPYGFYHYFSVDGGANDFNLNINDPLTSHPLVQIPSQFVDMVGYGVSGQALTPTFSPPDLGGHTNDAYLVSFLGGTTINATTAGAPFYKPRLAVCYFVPNGYGGFYNYLDNKYITSGTLGFKFIGSVDGQTHFGYMNVQVNTIKSNSIPVIQSVVIKDMYYEATPNKGIVVPMAVSISDITLGEANTVTINFSSNDAADASSFTLESSPTLGASANWTVDTASTISLITPENHRQGINKSTFQAVTTAVGGTAQFYRIKH